MMVPGGWLIDRFGKGRVLPIAVAIWTVVSMSTGTLGSLGAIFAARILLGLGEAPVYPCGNLIIREWAPLRERGVFTSLMQAGTLFGPAAAIAPAAYVVNHYGWRLSFLVLSASGLVWLAVWLLLYRTPEKARWISSAERQYIFANRAAEASSSRPAGAATMSIPLLLRQRPLIGILIANGTQTYAIYFLVTWLPSYLMSSERKFDLMHSGMLASAMFLAAMIGSIVLGKLSDRFMSLSAERARCGARRHAIAVVMLLALAGLGITPRITNQWALVGAIAMTLSMLTASVVLTFALTNDLITDEHSAGRTFGLVSFGGQIMGLLAPIVTGWIVGLSGYTPVFFVTAVLVLLGALAAWSLPVAPLQLPVPGKTRAAII